MAAQHSTMPEKQRRENELGKAEKHCQSTVSPYLILGLFLSIFRKNRRSRKQKKKKSDRKKEKKNVMVG